MKYGIGILIIIVLGIAGLMLWNRYDGSESMQTNEANAPQSAALVTETPEPPVEQNNKTKQKTITNKRVQNGMTIETIQEGNGEEIKNGQTAVVEYTGMLPDGTVFDASAKHGQPFSFPLGAGMVIKGWDQGVLGMKVGEKRKLTIPAELGYGAAGYPGVIPPNATLIFDVTLVAIK